MARIAAIFNLLAISQLLPAPVVGFQRYATEQRAEMHEVEASRTVKAQGGMKDASFHKKASLNKMSKAGVTLYKHTESMSRAKRTDGRFYWGDAANRDGNKFVGATDLSENVSWGWHHPAGVYNTIPVGSPLIDDQLNIYIGADDAIRKFDVVGDLKWSYAPRGQLAAAPTLVSSSARRMAAKQDDRMTQEEEEMLRPDWANRAKPAVDYDIQFRNLKVGDMVKVKPGLSFRADGRDLYSAGDEGLVSSVVPGVSRSHDRAVIQWGRSGHKSVVQLHAMGDRFVRVDAPQMPKAGSLPPMIVGSTTSGFVFAIDLETGEELWATSASYDIAGVKGSVAAKDGVVVVATNRCTDRYCYRYRNQTNVFTPGNSIVRGLSAVDGSAIWEFKPFAPVWNMCPLFGQNGDVMFQDWEGRAYSLDLATGDLRYKVGGNIGTHTQAAAVYDAGHNMLIALGVHHYSRQNFNMNDALGAGSRGFSAHCNPYVAPGILPYCWTWPGTKGFIRGYNASSGNKKWEVETPEPPAAAAAVMTKHWTPGHKGTRLVVTMGMNCHHNSPTQLWSLDSNNGHFRWARDGPTLWSPSCAGDREGADVRRAMGGRAACTPNSWSTPVVDAVGDIYVGNQVGVLQKWGSQTGRNRDVQLLSTLTTGVAFQDSAIAFADGIMAVSTCTSLIVFQTNGGTFFPSGEWSVSHPTS